MIRPRRPRRLVRRIAFASIIAASVVAGAAQAQPAPTHGVAPVLAQATTTRAGGAGSAVRRARTPPRSPTAQCLQRGEARWYGPGFNGRRTASGEVFDMNRMTAASRVVPFGSWVRVTRLDNGRSVVVKVNDRHAERQGMVIDLSRGAAQSIGMLGSGVARVCVTRAEAPVRATTRTQRTQRTSAARNARRR